jgi:hypothetical protein
MLTNESFINTIIFIIVMSIAGLIKIFKDNKDRKSKNFGREKTKSHISNLKFEVVPEQKRLVKEQSNIMYTQFHNKFCELLLIEPDSLAGQLIELHLIKVRKFTDKLMKEVIYNNNLAGRKGVEWSQYKEDKFNYIFQETAKHADEITNQNLLDLLKTDKESVNKILLPDTYSIYLKHIFHIFEIIRNAAKTYDYDISENKTQLKSIK